MPTHPNRSRRKPGPGRNPTPAEIRLAREENDHTEAQAAGVLYCTPAAWEAWEDGRRMHPAFFELYRLKTGQIDLAEVAHV